MAYFILEKSKMGTLSQIIAFSDLDDEKRIR